MLQGEELARIKAWSRKVRMFKRGQLHGAECGRLGKCALWGAMGVQIKGVGFSF